MLLDVLTRVSADTGYHAVQKRTALLNLLNNAAKEMYDSLECNDIYREVTCVVPRDKLVSLPSIIGPIRGVREHTCDFPFPMQSISAPRYVDERWNYKVRNWRILKSSPVHTFLSEIGPIIAETLDVNAGLSLLISGRTPNSERYEESITIDATPKNTLTAFSDINNISCTQERTYNITIKDSNQIEIAVLYNTENETRYLIVDVSQVFWSKDTANDETLVDICYKNPLWRFTKDSDVFPAGSQYDEAWYHLCMHKYFSPMQNRSSDASSERALYAAAMVEAKGSQESFIEKKFTFGPNKYFDLFNRPYSDEPFIYPFNCNP